MPDAVKPDKSVGARPSRSDLDRKRAALKAVEDAAEKLKEEAARNPKNAALAKAYLQLCEAALAHEGRSDRGRVRTREPGG